MIMIFHKRFYIYVVVCFALLSKSAIGLPKNPDDYRRWEENALQIIAGHANRGDDASFRELARYIYKLSLPSNKENGGRPVYHAAVDSFMKLDNHLLYLRGQIEKALVAEFAEARSAPLAVSDDLRRYEVFSIMEAVRSPQCVALLGELLDDDRDPWVHREGKDRSDYPPVNWTFAVKTLAKMEISNAPTISLDFPDSYEPARHQWKLWYDQVKAGNRTFRFEGDPQEYSLEGPVSKAMVPREERAVKDSQPLAEVVDGKAGLASQWPFWTAVVALALGAGAYLKMRRAA